MKKYTEAINSLKAAKLALTELDQADYNAAGHFMFARESFSFLNTLLQFFAEEKEGNIPGNALSKLKEELQTKKQDLEILHSKLELLTDTVEEKEREESKLQDTRRAYEKKQARLKEIENFQQDFEKIDLEGLAEILSSKEHSVEADLPDFETKLHELSDLMATIESKSGQRIKELLAKIERNKNRLKSGRIEAQESLDTELIHQQLEIKTFDRNFEEQLKEYNRYLEKLKDIRQQLDALDEVHLKNLKIYNKYFAENKKIWGELDQRGHTKEYIDEKIAEIAEGLAAFDGQLLEIIAEKNKLEIMEYKPKKN